jgi:hypothetical protein
MTCQDVKTIAHGTGFLPQNATRAERAAIFAHTHNCRACKFWLKAIEPIPSREQRQIERRLTQQDLQDEEYLAVIAPILIAQAETVK